MNAKQPIIEQVWKNNRNCSANLTAVYRFNYGKKGEVVRFRIESGGEGRGVAELWSRGKWNEVHTIPAQLTRTRYPFDRELQPSDFSEDLDALFEAAHGILRHS
jgi:hypothetical protein